VPLPARVASRTVQSPNPAQLRTSGAVLFAEADLQATASGSDKQRCFHANAFRAGAVRSRYGILG